MPIPKTGSPSGSSREPSGAQGKSPEKGEVHRSYRAGGVAFGETSERGPGGHGFDDREPDGSVPGAGGAPASGEVGAPGEAPHTDHQTYGAPGGDLGGDWGTADREAARARQSGEAISTAPAAPVETARGPVGPEGWSGRTGQDYAPDGEQAFDHRVRAADPNEKQRTDESPRSTEGEDAARMRGEAAFNQAVREPYGAYQGGYPGEGPRDPAFGAEYLSWRAEEIRKLDEDFEAWRASGNGAFDRPAFEAWRRARLSELARPGHNEPQKAANPRLRGRSES